MTEQLINIIYTYTVLIDKSLYITILFSFLTLHGILLAFLQFVASTYNQLTYMNRNLLFHKMVMESSCLKMLLGKIYIVFVVIVMIIPFVYKWYLINKAKTLVTNIIIFIWFGFVLFLFLLYMCAFYSSTRMIIRYTSVDSTMGYESIIREYNEKFVKLCCKKNKIDIEELSDIIECVTIYLNKNDQYNKYYSDLLDKVIRKYLYYKEMNKDKVNIDIYKIIDFKEEIDMINRVIANPNIKNKKINIFMTRNQINRINLELYENCLRNVEEIDYSIEREIKSYIKNYFCVYEKLLDEEPLKDDVEYMLIEEMLMDETFFHKTRLLNDVLMECYFARDFVFEKWLTMDESNASRLFLIIRKYEIVYNWFIEQISQYVERDKVENYDWLKYVKEEDKVYILLHVFFNRSIYAFREQWNTINIKFIRELVQDKKNLVKVIENNTQLIDRLKKPMNMHRFRTEMLMALVQYLNEPITISQLIKIKKEQRLDYRYYFVLRTICCSEYEAYDDYVIRDDVIKDELLDFFVQHPEFFEDIKFKCFYRKIASVNFCDTNVGDVDFWTDFNQILIANYNVEEQWLMQVIEGKEYIREDILKRLLIYYLEKQPDYMTNWIRNQYNDWDAKRIQRHVTEIVNTYKKYRISMPYMLERRLLDFFGLETDTYSN